MSQEIVQLKTTVASRFGKRIVLPHAGHVNVSPEGIIEVPATVAQLLTRISGLQIFYITAPAQQISRAGGVEAYNKRKASIEANTPKAAPAAEPAHTEDQPADEAPKAKAKSFKLFKKGKKSK